MIKKLIRLVLIFVVLALLSSCTDNIKAPAELIEKPQLSQENKMTKEAILRKLPKNTKLIRPLKPGNVKSVGYFDLNGDGIEEAYAFYKSDEDQTIGLLILNQENGDWEVLSQTEIVGEDIAYAGFVDFNSDGSKDLLFSSNRSDGVYGVINAYLWENGGYKNIWSGEFNELLVEDINGNKNKEIFCLKHDRGIYSDISAYKYVDKEFQIIDELEMDMYINGYYNVFVGNITKDQKAIFLDYKLGTKSASNIVLLKDDKLEPVLPPFDGAQSKIAVKDNEINSKDFDGDGITEIAANYDLAYSEKENRGKKGVYAWKEYDPLWESGFKLKGLSYIDKKILFEFVFPPKWRDMAEAGKISMVASGEGHKRDFVSFYYLTEHLESYLLLTLENFSEEKYKEFLSSDKKKHVSLMSITKRGNSRVVAYYNKNLEPDSQQENKEYKDLLMTKQELESAIRFLK